VPTRPTPRVRAGRAASRRGRTPWVAGEPGKGHATREEPAPAHAEGARIGAAMTGGITMAAAEMRKMDWLGYQTLAVLILFLFYFFVWPPGWLGWAARLAVWAGRLSRLIAWAGSAGPLAWLPGPASLAALCHLGRTRHARLGWAVRPHVWLDEIYSFYFLQFQTYDFIFVHNYYINQYLVSKFEYLDY
jgi:hypothetical protein